MLNNNKYREYFDIDERYFPCIDDAAIDAGAPWENTYPHSTFIDMLTEMERNHRDHIWGMMQSAVEREPEIYEKKNRAAILREIAVKYKTKPNNLYRYLDRYWRSGKTKNAFVPLFSNCGGKGKERSNYNYNTDFSSEPHQWKTIDDTDRQRFNAAVKKYSGPYCNWRYLVSYIKLVKSVLKRISELNTAFWAAVAINDSTGTKGLMMLTISFAEKSLN